MKSARAARPDPEEVRNSADKLDRRVASTRRLPRAAATNNTAVGMFRAGGDHAAAAATAQRRHKQGGCFVDKSRAAGLTRAPQWQ